MHRTKNVSKVDPCLSEFPRLESVLQEAFEYAYRVPLDTPLYIYKTWIVRESCPPFFIFFPILSFPPFFANFFLPLKSIISMASAFDRKRLRADAFNQSNVYRHNVEFQTVFKPDIRANKNDAPQF